MSHAEILAELPLLTQTGAAGASQSVMCSAGMGLDLERWAQRRIKKLLDDELEDYERTGDSGTPWEDFIAELPNRSVN